MTTEQLAALKEVAEFCSRCSGSLNRVGKTPNGSQKYRCSNCGQYDSEAKRRIAESKQKCSQQQSQKATENGLVIKNLRDAGFITRREMAQRLGVSLTWLTWLAKLGRLEEVRQNGKFGRYWIRELNC